MKKLANFLTVILISVVGISQNYNPFVAQGIIAPAPLVAAENNGTGQVSFVVGNSGSDPLTLVAGQEMKLTITLSLGVPDNVDPITAIGGSFAGYFDWVYDNLINTYQGTQNQTIPNGAGSAGMITIAYKVIANSIKTAPQNGFNVNITPPAYTVGINAANDDQVSSYTWTVFAVSGNVFNDLNGGTDNQVNGFGTNAGGALFVSLVNASNAVVYTTAVANDGSYSFPSVENAAYTLVLHTNTGGAATAALPANWVNTGDGIILAGDGTPDGRISITMAGGNISNANFGIEQYPFTNTNTATAQINPGGTNTVVVPAATFSGGDYDGGTVQQIHILGFPTNTTTMVVNGTSFNSGTFPGGGIYVSTNSAGNPTQTIEVDPEDGAVTVVISYNAVDNAGKEDPTPGTATIPILAEAADISITKTVDNASPVVGSNVVFTLTVSNAGPSAATGVSVSDGLPSGYSYVSDDGGGSYNSLTGTWTIGGLANGASATLHITATVLASGNYTNIATVSSTTSDPDNGNNTASANTTPTASADISITKTVDNASPVVGSNVVFTLTVSNAGPSAATGVSVSDGLPSGYSYVSDDGGGSYNSLTGTWTIGGLANGASATLHITATVLASGNYTNIATVSSTTSDPDNGNNTASANTIPTASADISITKTVDNASPVVGSNVVFTLTVSNAGPSAATGVSVSDGLPSGYSYVSDDGGGSYNSLTGTWTIGGLANGASATLHITATVLASGNYTNIATVSSTTSDPDNGNNTASANTTPTASADISITKTVDNAYQPIGSNVQFTVTVTNNGPSVATGVIVTDLLPSGFTYISAIPSQGTYNSVNGQWSIGSLLNANSASIVLTATVLASGNHTNIASVIANEPDPQPENNQDETTNFTIQANDDSGSADGVTGGTAIANVLVNDNVNSVAATTGNIILTVVTPASNPGVILNTTTGAVTVAAGTPAGVYTVVYRICDQANPSNCDQATVSIAVGSTISGHVYDDANGMTDALINGTGTNAGGILYVSLVNSSNTVINTTPVAADGSYSFNNVGAGNYTVILHTSPAGATTAALPVGYVNTAEGLLVSGDGTADGVIAINFNTSVNTANFGIEQLPVAGNQTTTQQINPGGNGTVIINANAFSGTDADGLISYLTITSFPSNTEVLVVNNIPYTISGFPIGGIQVPTNAAGQPTQTIAINPVDGFVNVVISYTVTDNAGYVSLNPGAVTIPFTVLPDVTPNITAMPNSMAGITNFDVTVKITELNNVNTNGTITVIIPKDSRVSFTYDPSLVSIGSPGSTTALNNNNWSYDNSNQFYHIFTSNTVIPGQGFSTFGFSAVFNPLNAKGLYTLTSTIISGSGGENKTTNNNDAEKLEYFPN